MDEQQQQRVNKAAEELTNALVESFRVASERGVNAQEQNARLTEDFFNRTVENLRAQAEGTRQMGQQLAEQQQRATEAGQQLTQESVNAYMDFVNSMFNFGQAGVQTTQRATDVAVEGVQRVTREVEGSTAAVEEAPGEDTSTTTTPEEPQAETTTALEESSADAEEELPIEEYDSLNVEQISQRLEELSDEQLEQLRRYEAANKNRSTLLRRLDERLEA